MVGHHEKLRYRRILLKMSGEILMGHSQFGIDPNVLDRIASEVTEIAQLGVEVGIVMGGGNLFVIDEEDERNKRIIAVANILAEKYATGADVILLSWLMTHPASILPVMGTSKIERIHAAVAATLLKLEREEWFMLWRASTGREVA